MTDIILEFNIFIEIILFLNKLYVFLKTSLSITMCVKVFAATIHVMCTRNDTGQKEEMRNIRAKHDNYYDIRKKYKAIFSKILI